MMGSIRLAVLFLMVFCVGLQSAEDLQMGSSIGNKLVYTEDVNLRAIPLTTRTKNVFYNGNATLIIKGIWAIDRDQSTAKVTVTSGGVGSTFVNVRIKSDRGNRLFYQVQVFA